ncbi:DUF397 domain-containing protein [Actinophytocola sediminis]
MACWPAVSAFAQLTALRDSKSPASGALVLSPRVWHAFRTATKQGGCDLPGA